ncbi:MAG: winged helix-turn-helix domain-containing protein [Propionicimonas sp.]
MTAPPAAGLPLRRAATDAEAKALANVLRQRIVRLTSTEELTNRQLADQLGVDPATSLYHVRILVDAGFLEPLPARRGTRGAREKPYRSTRRTWWLSDPLAGADPGIRFSPVALAMQDALTAGPDQVSTFATFALHLTDAEVDELDARLVEVIDSYVATDRDRADAGHPVRRGLFLLHRVTPSGHPVATPPRPGSSSRAARSATAPAARPTPP